MSFTIADLGKSCTDIGGLQAGRYGFQSVDPFEICPSTAASASAMHRGTPIMYIMS
jgi:hypothetical protein